MNDRERCHVCDAVLATEADTDTLSGLTLMALCWSSLIGAPCNRPPVNWRDRALAAEAALESASTLAAIRVSLVRLADEADLQLTLAGPCLREACRAIDRAMAGGFPP